MVGLGNPGARYVDTRHNLGFRVVEELARRRRAELTRLDCNALVAELQGGLLAAPQTFMNRSGYAVRCLVERHGFETDNLLIVFDDISLPLGKLRLRLRGGPGGHRGMESVVNSLRTEDIARLRLGVAPGDREIAPEDWPEFVLAPFDESERELAGALVERAADACESWWTAGGERAMNLFNS